MSATPSHVMRSAMGGSSLWILENDQAVNREINTREKSLENVAHRPDAETCSRCPRGMGPALIGQGQPTPGFDKDA